MTALTAEQRMSHQVSLLRELADATGPTMAILRGIEAGDINDEELLVVGALSMNPRTGADLLGQLGIGSQTFGKAVDGLVELGYLRRGDEPEEQTVRITDRGSAIVQGIKAGTIASRWADLEFRPGDIIVATHPKSGTTWSQMICALLIFRTPDLPATLRELSPGIDDLRRPRDEVFAALAALQHRRFMKTHLALDELPDNSAVSYLFVGRHPLDIAASTLAAKASVERGRTRSRGEQPSIHDQMLRWMDADATAGPRVPSLANVMRHMKAAWERRDDPRVLLLHYAELSADLEGQMRAVATRLGISVPETAWPALVEAATFNQMRANASQLQPLDNLRDPASFFWRGKSGSGRAELSDDELARYHDRAASLVPDDLLAWLHR